MAKEYVERDMAEDAIQNILLKFQATTGEMVQTAVAIGAIRCVPAADVAPVVHARWSPAEYKPYYYAACTQCGRRIEALAKDQYPYCPGCGAKMDAPADSTHTR